MTTENVFPFGPVLPPIDSISKGVLPTDVRRDARLSDDEVSLALNNPQLQEVFGDVIEAALASGALGTGRPPEGHWLERFWKMSHAQSETSEIVDVESAAVALSMKRGAWGSLSLKEQDNLRAVARDSMRKFLPGAFEGQSAPLDPAASSPAIASESDKEADEVQRLAKIAYEAGQGSLLPTLRGKPWELAGTTNMIVWTSAIEAVLSAATSAVAITQDELEDIRLKNISMLSLDCDEVAAMRDAIALYETRSTTLAPYADAARYRKLRGWMSSNVPEGWEEVCRMAALACWMDWAAFDGYLDALPRCNVGLMQTTPSTSSNQDPSC